jgi:hypothetical protein
VCHFWRKETSRKEISRQETWRDDHDFAVRRSIIHLAQFSPAWRNRRRP